MKKYIIRGEYLPYIIIEDEEHTQEEIIENLLSHWGDANGNLIIETEDYNFFESQLGFQYWSFVMNEELFEDFIEEVEED